jgi:hypothetical protein
MQVPPIITLSCRRWFVNEILIRILQNLANKNLEKKMASFDPFAAASEDLSTPSISFSAQEWTEHTDPTTGKKYYSNSRTGATSWESPYPQKVTQQFDFMADDIPQTTLVAEPESADPGVRIEK